MNLELMKAVKATPVHHFVVADPSISLFNNCNIFRVLVLEVSETSSELRGDMASSPEESARRRLCILP